MRRVWNIYFVEVPLNLDIVSDHSHEWKFEPRSKRTGDDFVYTVLSGATFRERRLCGSGHGGKRAVTIRLVDS